MQSMVLEERNPLSLWFDNQHDQYYKTNELCILFMTDLLPDKQKRYFQIAIIQNQHNEYNCAILKSFLKKSQNLLTMLV